MIDHQLAALAEEADDLRVRSLVGESPLADREHRDAQRTVDAMARSRAATTAEIAKLQRTIDALLEQFVPSGASSENPSGASPANPGPR